MGDRAGSGDRLRPAAAQGRPGRGHRLRQPGPHPRAVHQRRRRARKGDPPDDAERIDLALQRDLHLAEGAEEGQGGVDRRRSAARRSSLLSDGDDTSSLIEFDEVLDLAKRSETAIYAIGLRQGEIGRREFKEAEFVLKQLAQETGGRAFFPTDARELPKIYQAIWDELASQYAIAYSSSNPKRDGAWRRIQVRLHAAERRRRAPSRATTARPDRSDDCTSPGSPSCSTPRRRPPISRTSRGAIRAPAGSRRRCSAAPSSRTPSSSACRRCRRATRRSSARRRRSRRSSGCSAWRTSTSS